MNLIKKYDIKSTRTSFYKKPEKHADYIFVSDDIFVETFQVLSEEVSDHAALLVKFE
jgi:endonuclease/exonuclease/phosphatase (EEP) superfamily protein YafD